MLIIFIEPARCVRAQIDFIKFLVSVSKDCKNNGNITGYCLPDVEIGK